VESGIAAPVVTPMGSASSILNYKNKGNLFMKRRRKKAAHKRKHHKKAHKKTHRRKARKSGAKRKHRRRRKGRASAAMVQE
jgi:type IV secretory pathway VirB9-like protein